MLCLDYYYIKQCESSKMKNYLKHCNIDAHTLTRRSTIYNVIFVMSHINSKAVSPLF